MEGRHKDRYLLTEKEVDEEERKENKIDQFNTHTYIQQIQTRIPANTQIQTHISANTHTHAHKNTNTHTRKYKHMHTQI